VGQGGKKKLYVVPDKDGDVRQGGGDWTDLKEKERESGENQQPGRLSIPRLRVKAEPSICVSVAKIRDVNRESGRVGGKT